MTIDEARALQNSNDTYFSKVYKYVAEHGQNKTLGDSSGDEYVQLSSNDIDNLSDIMFDELKARNPIFETPQEAYDKTVLKIVGDQMINDKLGWGTLADPQNYTHSNIPIMMGPYEATGVYSSGGLPAQIIDKKAHGMALNGATFVGFDDSFWTNEKVNMLEEAAETTGFNSRISDAITEAFIYGGSVIFPTFRRGTSMRDTSNLEKSDLEPGCIERWDHVDRWNIVYVPGLIVTTKDYLSPKSIYIPQASRQIDHTHYAILKPKPMPYWAAIANLGWAPSDMTGWLRSYYGYKITCSSLPVMAQQMSLILYRMPLDALNATIGHENVKKLMEINETKMAEWNTLSPKAVNMVGEVEVVDRTYSGIEQLISAMKSDLASSCGLTEPLLWHTPNKGFSDNVQESMLKQSETLRMHQTYIERALPPLTDALIAHTFGTNSEEWKQRRRIRMTFNKPMITTEKDMAEVGARFAASIASFAQSGISPDIALKIATQFFPTVKITQETFDRVKESYDNAQVQASSINNMVQGPKDGNGEGQGHTKGNVNKNTGKLT